MSAATDQARDEAYASAPVDQEPCHVISLDNVGWAAPLHFMSGVEEDVQIRLETGETALAIACAFEFTPPGFGDDGPSPARLAVDSVSGQIAPYLKQATSEIRVTYRAYLGNDRTTVVDLIEGLLMKRVTLSGASAEGDLTFAEIASQAFPRRTYDLSTYPGLWNT